MQGEFFPVWRETWREILSKLATHPGAPDDLFSELYRVFIQPPVPPLAPTPSVFDDDGNIVLPEDKKADTDYRDFLVMYSVERARYEEAISGDRSAKRAFKSVYLKITASEEDAMRVMEKIFRVIDDFDVDNLRNGYFLLVDKFIEKYNLRYALRRPFTLHPTPSGIYAKLYAEIVNRCQQDVALSALLRDYREAFQDIKFGPTSGRINTCLQKQVNLLEGLASINAEVKSLTLGQMCNELKTWPSTAVSEAAKSLYGFASDHTGLRHGTIKKTKFGKTPTVYRDMEMRDLVAVSVFFTGLSAYLSTQIDSQIVYGG
jgi:hypothetical protein